MLIPTLLLSLAFLGSPIYANEGAPTRECTHSMMSSCIYLCLHIAPKSSSSSPACTSPIYLYYKGHPYFCPMKSVIGDTVRMPESRIPHSILVVVTPCVSDRTRNGKVIGLRVTNGIPCSCYRLSYIVNDNGISYHWEIEEVENISGRIPEDALIILTDPKALTIHPFESSFAPSCPTTGNNSYGALILPTFLIDCSAIQKDAPLMRLDSDYCHAPRPSLPIHELPDVHE